MPSLSHLLPAAGGTDIGASRPIELPYVIGRSSAPGAPIPNDVRTVSRRAAAISRDAAGELSLQSTHSAPVCVVRDGRMHELWQGDPPLALRDADVIVVQGHLLMQSLGLSSTRGTNNATGAAVVGADKPLHSFCAFKLQMVDEQPATDAPVSAQQQGLVQLDTPSTLSLGSETPATDAPVGVQHGLAQLAIPTTFSCAAPPVDRTVQPAASAAAALGLAAQLAAARTETVQAQAEVIELILDALVIRVEAAGGELPVALGRADVLQVS
jgi:hypothetical protein